MPVLPPDSVLLVIFDADDTLRRTTAAGQPCPHRPGEWELLPDVREILSQYEWGADGCFVGIASNQDQVAYGHLSDSMCHRLLTDMVNMAFGNLSPEACIRFCPHALDVPCACRKPGPGLLVEIMNHFGVRPERTLFVGNAASDEAAARKAGCRFSWAQSFFDPNNSLERSGLPERSHHPVHRPV